MAASASSSAVVEATADNVAGLFDAVEPNKLAVCFFWATFHEPSNRGGQLDRVFALLAQSFPGVQFIKIEADQHEDVAERFQVHVIPTFVFLTRTVGDVEVLDRITTGATPRELKTKIKSLRDQLQHRQPPAPAAIAAASAASAAAAVPAADGSNTAAAAAAATTTTSAAAAAATPAALVRTIAPLVNAAHVVLFMDGTPEAPGSAASAEAVALLKACQFKFGHYDLRSDADGRVARVLAALSASASGAGSDAAGGGGADNDTVTPQLFVGGQQVGDHTRMAALHAAGALEKLKPASAPSANLNTYLAQLIARDDVTLFMKGTPQEPRCGFSRKMVALLNEHDVPFGSFNILTDDAVRQGLKTYSNWPTYPQLYVKGKLIGGLDIVQEMAEDEDDLREAMGLPAAKSEDDRIRELLRAPAILFMKGSPNEPRCGFSRKAVALLRECNFPFEHFDILLDNGIRERLKTFSNWPTYPQLYVGGKLVGGLDIMQELHEDGELEEMKPSEA